MDRSVGLRSKVNYLFQLVHLIFINGFYGANEANICYTILDDNFLSILRHIILNFHYIVIIKLVDESNHHHTSWLSSADSTNVRKPFFLKHLSHDLESFLLFWLIFSLCHEILKFDVLSHYCAVKGNSFVIEINMLIENRFKDSFTG